MSNADIQLYIDTRALWARSQSNSILAKQHVDKSDWLAWEIFNKEVFKNLLQIELEVDNNSRLSLTSHEYLTELSKTLVGFDEYSQNTNNDAEFFFEIKLRFERIFLSVESLRSEIHGDWQEWVSYKRKVNKTLSQAENELSKNRELTSQIRKELTEKIIKFEKISQREIKKNNSYYYTGDELFFDEVSYETFDENFEGFFEEDEYSILFEDNYLEHTYEDNVSYLGELNDYKANKQKESNRIAEENLKIEKQKRAIQAEAEAKSELQTQKELDAFRAQVEEKENQRQAEIAAILKAERKKIYEQEEHAKQEEQLRKEKVIKTQFAFSVKVNNILSAF